MPTHVRAPARRPSRVLPRRQTGLRNHPLAGPRPRGRVENLKDTGYWGPDSGSRNAVTPIPERAARGVVRAGPSIARCPPHLAPCAPIPHGLEGQRSRRRVCHTPPRQSTKGEVTRLNGNIIGGDIQRISVYRASRCLESTQTCQFSIVCCRTVYAVRRRVSK